MLDLKDISKEVRRLGGLEFPPSTPEGWRELSKVLQRRCLSMEHVARVIDRWIETEDKCPTPAKLGSCACNVPADPAMDSPVLADPCEECAPDGLWRSIQRLQKNGDFVWCLGRCNCARGRQLAALDAIRVNTELAKQRKAPGRITPIGGMEDAS